MWIFNAIFSSDLKQFTLWPKIKIIHHMYLSTDFLDIMVLDSWSNASTKTSDLPFEFRRTFCRNICLSKRSVRVLNVMKIMISKDIWRNQEKEQEINELTIWITRCHNYYQQFLTLELDPNRLNSWDVVWNF